jgi:hypothetical protein
MRVIMFYCKYIAERCKIVQSGEVKKRDSKNRREYSARDQPARKVAAFDL